MSKRNFYVIGEDPPFRLSKDRCQRLLAAIVASSARITDSDTFSFHHGTGALQQGITLGRADAIFMISIPEGSEKIFDHHMGENIREIPPEVGVN